MTEGSTSDHGGEKLSGAEIGKDAVQSTIEAAATAVGEVATILTKAVRDVATTVGDFATEVFEIRDASRKAADDAGAVDVPIPEVDEQVED
jgi:ABC-type transporter Mla subunit MlaD